jgi:predicted flap endonuclease-1-like 5' DNA nuclease
VDTTRETPAESVETATNWLSEPVVTPTGTPKAAEVDEVDEAKTVVSSPPVYAGATVPHDDLKLIPGIGPVYEGLFNQRGITTFAQLSYLSVDQVRDILTNPEVMPVTDDQARTMIYEAGLKIND